MIFFKGPKKKKDNPKLTASASSSKVGTVSSRPYFPHKLIVS